MPIVPQSIGHHVSLGADPGGADGEASIVQRLDFVLGLIIPEVHSSV